MRCLGLFGKVCGNRPFLSLSVAAHGIRVSLHRDQIHDACKITFGANRKEYRYYLPSESCPERFQHTVLVRAITIHAIHDNNAGHVHLSGVIPTPAGHCLNATHAIDYDQRRLRGNKRRLGLMQEHIEAGRVDQIDLALVPFAVCRRHRDRHLPGNLFLVPRGSRRTVVHPSEAGSRASCIQQG